MLNSLPVIHVTNHKGAIAAAAADPVDNVAAPAGCKAYKRLSSKELFVLKGGITGEQATAVVKVKQACDSKRKAEEQVVQSRMKQWRLDVHVVSIMLADAIVESPEGEAPWTDILLQNLGMKTLAGLIVRKGAKPNPRGKKADLLLQFGVLWDTN